MKIVSVVSGGLDSVVMAYWYHHRGHEQEFLAFNYGQHAAESELRYARLAAKRLRVPYFEFDLSDLASLLPSNCVNGVLEVPRGAAARNDLAPIDVPIRNASFISIAFARAIEVKAQAVALAAQGRIPGLTADSLADCSPGFLNGLQAALAAGAAFPGRAIPTIIAPFVDWSKAEIVKLGADLDVPLADTWTCHVAGERQCGTCRACQKRREGFAEANIPDPTEYEDA